MADHWQVSIAGLEVFGRHGVFDAEHELGQRFVVDLEMELRDCPGGESDLLEDTVDYAAIADKVAAIVGGAPVRLLERLAARIADTVLSVDERIAAVAVTVRKPHVALTHRVDDVRVRIRRESDG